MYAKPFNWAEIKPLSIAQILFAVFAPSAVAYAGFRGVLPDIVKAGLPPLLAWLLVAGVLLSVFAVVAGLLLVRDARKSDLDIKSRLCLVKVTWKQWLMYVGLAILVMMVTAGMQNSLPAIWQALGIHPPDYFPFFLRGLDPTSTSPEVISPGLPLRGTYWLIPIMAIVLLLNIIVEDFYFRAWLLPRMAWMGSPAWVVNGILFVLYHTFQLWLFPIILIASLVFAFVVWHSKSVIPSLVLHFVLNFLMSILGILALVMGSAG